MARKRAEGAPAGLESVRRRLERWRRSAGRGRSIPADVWQDAAALARSHGVNRIAQALGLNYDNLKARAAGAETASRGNRRRTAPPAGFVEVDLATTRAPGCVLELENRLGTKLVLRFDGTRDVDLVALVDAFLGRKR